MLFDFTIIGFGVIGVQTLVGVKKICYKIKIEIKTRLK